MTATAFGPHSHVYVDESKTHGYFIAAAAVSPADSKAVDRALRQLPRPGQSRIHFTREKDSSRRKLLSQMAELDVQVQLYIVRGQPDKIARTLCLEALVDDLAQSGASRLILERDDSLMVADRRIISDSLSRNNYREQLSFDHVAPTEHATLWVSDAIAWCHQAGGDWIRRASPLVAGTRILS